MGRYCLSVIYIFCDASDTWLWVVFFFSARCAQLDCGRVCVSHFRNNVVYKVVRCISGVFVRGGKGKGKGV